MSYSDIVNYEYLDPVKQFAMELFSPTLSYPERLGLEVNKKSIGEPAAVIRIKDPNKVKRIGFNVEGLGTKNLIAEEMYELRDKVSVANEINITSLFQNIGIDTVAMSALDQLAVYSDIVLYGDIITSGKSSYFIDENTNELNEKTKQLLLGYRKAADEVKFAIVCGETPTLADIVNPNTLDLAGASVGVIHPNASPIGGQNIKEGQRIVGLSSNGLHANGISKVRRLKEKLKDGWFTELPDGSLLGEEVLKPTHIYTRPVVEMLDRGIEISYMGPITGHGWKKIMRPKLSFTYIIQQVPELSPLYQFLIEEGRKNNFNVTNEENYKTWNMGIGWFMIADRVFVDEMRKIAKRYNLTLYDLGYVKKGERKVVMPVKDDGKRIVYTK